MIKQKTISIKNYKKYYIHLTVTVILNAEVGIVPCPWLICTSANQINYVCIPVAPVDGLTTPYITTVITIGKNENRYWSRVSSVIFEATDFGVADSTTCFK